MSSGATPDVSRRRVLLTGASGFVGGFVAYELVARGWQVVTAGRRPAGTSALRSAHVPLDLDEAAALQLPSQMFVGIDAVVHLAARVHVMDHRAGDDEYFHGPNVLATRRLAEAAANAGVRRFLFMSSIKVHGDGSGARPFRADDAPAPTDAYGRSKHRAELELREVAERGGLQVAVVRPPLVYGPGVGGNFLRMLRWVDRGVPMPLAGIRNRRSLVNAWNLADLVGTVLAHPDAVGRAWLVSDGPSPSTSELLEELAAVAGRPSRLVGVPAVALRALGGLIGRTAEIERLLGSLVVDDAETRDRLGWRPVVEQTEGLRRTVEWYRKSRHDAAS